MQLHIIGLQVTVQYLDRAVKFKCNISLSWLGTYSNKGCGYFLLNLADFLPKGCCLTAIFVKYILEDTLKMVFAAFRHLNSWQWQYYSKYAVTKMDSERDYLSSLDTIIEQCIKSNFLAITDRKTDTHYGI